MPLWRMRRSKSIDPIFTGFVRRETFCHWLIMCCAAQQSK
jgi:hypothetical protein